MYFIDGFVALAGRLGMVPDDVLILSFLMFAFFMELLGWGFFAIFRFLRWLSCYVVRWFHSCRKKDL